MKELRYLAYALVGFSTNQILGILLSGFGIHQALITFLILCAIALVPGFLYWGGRQSQAFSRLNNAQIFSCFIPSLIAIGIASTGFIIGVIVGL